MTQSDYLLNSPKLADKRTVIRYKCLNSGSQHITAPALEMTVSLQPWSANTSSAQSLAFRRTPTQGPPSGARSGSPVCPSHTVTPSAMRHLPGSVKIITREGLCSCEDLQLCCLPARGNGKILLMFTALPMCMCVYGSGGRVMLCAPVMPEAWAALLSSSQACLPSQNVLTSGGSVCKCDVDVFAGVCVRFGVCEAGVQQLWWGRLLLHTTESSGYRSLGSTL